MLIDTIDLELAKEATGVGDVKKLTALINASLQVIAKILGVDTLEITERDEYVKGLNSNYVYTKARPIKSVLNVIDTYYNTDITALCYERTSISIGFRKIICNGRELNIKFVAGYDKLNESQLMTIFDFIKDFLASSSEEKKLKSYKIETIQYEFENSKELYENFIKKVKLVF